MLTMSDRCGRGPTLEEIVKGAEFGLPEFVASQHLAQVLCGLIYLHRHGIAHGALRAENLILCPDGCVKMDSYGILQDGMILGNQHCSCRTNKTQLKHSVWPKCHGSGSAPARLDRH